MKKTPSIVVMLVAALGFGGLAYYVSSSPSARNVPAEMRKPKEKVGGGFFIPSVDGENVTLSDEKLSKMNGVSDELALAQAAAKAAGSERSLVTGVKREGAQVTLELDSARVYDTGSMQESTLIKAWQVALGQLPGVQTLRLEVDGKPIESLGHFEVDQPIDVVKDAGKPAQP
jgi:hypothetical protein